jgi:hypothetical protein
LHQRRPPAEINLIDRAQTSIRPHRDTEPGSGSRSRGGDERPIALVELAPPGFTRRSRATRLQAGV